MRISLNLEDKKFILTTVSDLSISIVTNCQVISSIRGGRKILPLGDMRIEIGLDLFNSDRVGEVPFSEFWGELGWQEHTRTFTAKQLEELWQSKSEFEIELNFKEEENFFETILFQKCVLSDFNPLILNDQKFSLKIISRNWYAI